jgi:type I restriction enzyme, S subunit
MIIYAKEPLKYLASINDEVLTEQTNPCQEIKYIDIGNIDSSGRINEIAEYKFEDAPSRARRIVRHGDIVISTVRTYLQAIAPIESPPNNLIVSTGFAVVRSKRERLDASYCKYALRTPEFIGEVVSRSVGISYPAINVSDLGNIEVYIPSLSKQRQIAEYLDHETQKIDALIGAKKRLLELLAEKRKALITQAVTCGPKTDVPMRDSGIEWLGEIPENWKVVSLSFLGKVRTGVTKGRNLDNSETVQVPYLRVANVQDGYLNLEDVATIEVLPEEVASFSLQKGDVLMNEGGDADKLGRGAVWNGLIEPCLHQNHVFAVRCHSVEPDWLATVTSSDYAKAYFESHAKQSTNLASISSTNLKELPVVLPPREMQRKIVQDLRNSLAQLDGLYTATKATIQLLQERRTSLISAAVTGQLKIAD